MAKTKNTVVERRAFSYEEVAAMMGKHRTWVYRQVAAGRITAITGFGAAMIPASEVDRITGKAPQEAATAARG